MNGGGLIPAAGTRRSRPVEVLIVGLVIITLVGALHAVPFLSLLTILVGLSAAVAWRFPVFMIVATVVVGQILHYELASLIGLSEEGVNVGAMHLRFADLPLAGMAVSTTIRLLRREEPAMRMMTPSWIFFLLLLLFGVVRNVGAYGINTVGELRTYYHFPLLILYMAGALRTDQQIRMVFRLLIICAFSHLFLGVLKGGVLHDFRLSAYEKWLSSFGALALVSGSIALVLLKRTGEIRIPAMVVGGVLAGAVALIVISGARSVWLSGMFGMILIAISSFSFRTVAASAGVGLVGLIVLMLPFGLAGESLFSFVSSRLMALTDYELDPTSLWRYYFWLAALEGIVQNPVLGTGFGRHFDIFVPELNEAFTTSPHNLYLTILLQTGILGLLLYVWWGAGIIRLLTGVKQAMNGIRAPVLAALIIFLALHVYGIAFSFEKDFISWAFVGSGISAALLSSRSGKSGTHG